MAADRQTLGRMLELRDHPIRLIRAGPMDGNGVQHLSFATSTNEILRGILGRPPGAGPFPAILYIHAHGGRYDIGADECFGGRKSLVRPMGPDLVAAGFVVLMIEAPAFGTRADPGESARSKAALWHGRSLAGQMLGELSSALDWLSARPEVRPDRVGAFGISMGATLGYWLAAADPRIAAVAHLCCFADFDALIEAGAQDLHGIYLTVPGLLDVASNGVIAGLVAPRPQLVCIGDRDPLTPPEAVDRALAETRAAYAAAGASGRLHLIRDPATGHWETPAMRDGALAFLRSALQD